MPVRSGSIGRGAGGGGAARFGSKRRSSRALTPSRGAGQAAVSAPASEDEDEPRWLFLPVTEHLRAPGVQAAARVADYGATANQPGQVKLGSVGIPNVGAEVKLADDGEILTRHPGVFVGYFKNEIDTIRALGRQETIEEMNDELTRQTEAAEAADTTPDPARDEWLRSRFDRSRASK